VATKEAGILHGKIPARVVGEIVVIVEKYLREVLDKEKGGLNNFLVLGLIAFYP
jgi:hypothetical protein